MLVLSIAAASSRSSGAAPLSRLCRRGQSAGQVRVERFTRRSGTILDYEATITDPKTFTDRIVISFPMAKVDAPIYESGCHEHNYSLSNVLSGARAEERAAAKTTATPDRGKE